jgi:hypothetical protein
VASVCTNGRPVAWRGELAVGGHGGAVAACGAGRRGRTREADWLPSIGDGRIVSGLTRTDRRTASSW